MLTAVADTAVTATPDECPDVDGAKRTRRQMHPVTIHVPPCLSDARVAWIRAALDNELFVVYGQPVVDILTGATSHHELLIRMRATSGTIIEPRHFLPAAEKYDLIQEIDRWMLGRAAQLASRGVPVAVNVSARSISRACLLGPLRELLADTGADPANLTIELTETALLAAPDDASKIIEGVRALGVRVALDDFGTGYGCFSYLKRMPVDSLKIAGEFVTDLLDSPVSRQVVEAIVALAGRSGQQTVAEAVEDAPTLRELRKLGVSHAQGYHLGRPELLEADGHDAHALAVGQRQPSPPPARP
jgi:EAL domain-containing protein (putative c-di-GMP-specific phosphodiesterase class I)